MPENLTPNFETVVVDGFGDEWRRFDQSQLSEQEVLDMFERYFQIFPWHKLPPKAVGFDMGCGSGRWAKLVGPRVAHLHAVDASSQALDVAKKNLSHLRNCTFHLASVEQLPLPDNSMDFGYSLGVLHHIPNTLEGFRSCVRKLKPGAPFLVYLYYRFDNRPWWFQGLWQVTEVLRRTISRLPFFLRSLCTDALALLVYWPLARLAKLLEKISLPIAHWPLAQYRSLSFYTMRTDALDRFGTQLEQRFTAKEISEMMLSAGLKDVQFSKNEPYWVAVGFKDLDESTK